MYPAKRIFTDDRVAKSIADPKNCFGHIGPSLIKKIEGMIASNPSLNDDEKKTMIGSNPASPTSANTPSNP